MSATRVRELLTEIDQTGWGPAERALVDEAMRLVRDLDDEELEYQVRMRLTASARIGGDTDTMLSSFAWCLARYDADPQRFPADLENGAADLLWQYKWMANALASSPIFPQEQIDAVLDDMEAHYQRAGLGMSGVLMSRFEAAWAQGRLEEAEQLRQRVLATPRDEHSHCEACGPSQHAAFLAETGREAEALALTDEMLESGASCGEEPEHAMARSLLPLLRAGRLDDAKAAHMRAYRMSRHNPDHLAMIADHLVFCAVTGNEARGLAMLERHLPWLAHDGLNVAAQTQAMRAIGVLLDAVDRAGYGDTPVRGSDAPDLAPFFGEPEAPASARELAALAWAWAEQTGRAFDERNGNDYHARLDARARALADEHYDVPIETETFAPVVTVEPDPTDGPGWLARAFDLRSISDVDGAIEAAAAAVRHGDLSPDQQAEALSLLATLLLRLGEEAEAAAVMTDRLAALRAAGRHAEAAMEQRLGRIAHTEDTEEALPVVRAELEAAVVGGADPAVLTSLRGLLAYHLEQVDQTEEAVALAEQVREALRDRPQHREYRNATGLLTRNLSDPEVALGFADELIALDLNRAERAFVQWHRARLLGGLGRFADGGRAADEAMAGFAALGARKHATAVASLAGHLYDDADEPEESVQRFRFAVAQAELAESDATGLRFELGRTLVRSGRPDEAAEVLHGVLEAETEAGVEPASRALTAFWLGHAYNDSGAYGAALGTWGQAAELFREGGEHLGAARSFRLQAQLLMQFGEHEDGREAAAAALEEARAAEEPDLDLLLNSLHLLGNLEVQVQGEPGLARLREARDLATAHPDRPGWQWQVADITDSEARALKALGRHDEAIAHGLYGADLYAQAGDLDGAAAAEGMVAGILLEQDRHSDSVPILQGAAEKAEHPMLRARLLLDLAGAFEQLGRHDDAARARAAAEQD